MCVKENLNYRKVGVYALLIFLAIITVVNIGITLWLLATIHFNSVGPVTSLKLKLEPGFTDNYSREELVSWRC